MTDPPITQWIAGAKRREPEAEQALWNHYFERLVRMARSRMFALQGSLYDEEDAAISAIHSVFRGLQTERFPELRDRNNLWRILVLTTNRKLRDQWRRENAQRRNQPAADAPVPAVRIEDVICDEPSPDFVAEMMDQTEALLDQLGDDTLRRIAVMKLDGLTYDEIAKRLKCTSRTVCRKMQRIRDLWNVGDEG